LTTKWRILLVDDDLGIHTSVTEYAARRGTGKHGDTVECVDDFEVALSRLAGSPPDMVILDVRNFHTRSTTPDETPAEDDTAGRRLYERLSEHRFVPVVFYTAVEHLVDDLHEPPLRSVLGKTTGLKPLFDALDAVVDSGLPAVLRDLDAHVAAVIRRYVGGYVRGQWQALAAAGVTPQHLGRQLVELLAASLRRAVDDGTDSDLAQRLSVGDSWHPALYYVHPPIGDRLDTGDIVRLDDRLFGLVVTPSCTLEHGKYDTLNMIAAEPIDIAASTGSWLAESRRLKAVGSDKTPAGNAVVKEILAGKSVRHFYLPAYLDVVPDLIVDVERSLTVSRAAVVQPVRVTSLSERYKAAVLAHRERYFQRIGLTDLPVERVLDGLRRGSGA
jgi:CheY-like chemotaxis protein